ncbi:MAG: TIGR04282 family arsenosugar biosynthesis glycosyltransferase [Gammaproteobacteria bacterium AqS3]|nr:TIGR04282 family arsenosugar biosynthesis glycosyltransferase [Gammaproteobacteria bacterium AqS3]
MTRLAMLVREPVVGRVKTRLAADLGPERACAIHVELTERCLRNLHPAGLQTQLWIAGDAEAPSIEPWCTWCDAVLHQPEGDLGERLEAVFRWDSNPTIAVGSDCPELGAAHLLEVRETLAQGGVDAVICAAEDGGFVLLGLRAWRPGIFSGIEWGSPSVLNRLTANMLNLGVRYRLLGEFYDIDTLADWSRWCDSQAAETALKSQ